MVGEHYAGQNGIRITALDCVHYRDICSSMNIKSYPTIKVYGAPKEPSSFQKEGYTLDLSKGKESAEYIINWIDTEIVGAGGVGDNNNNNIRNEDASLSLHEPLLISELSHHSGERWPSTYTSATLMPARLRLGDVGSSLLFALRYGVFVDGDELKDPQRLALGTFLSVLTKAFPGPSSDRHLISNLLTLVDSGELKNDKQWENYLSTWNLQGRVATSELRWSGLCDPSRRKQDEFSKASGRHIRLLDPPLF
jgi:hypothetical protein